MRFFDKEYAMSFLQKDQRIQLCSYSGLEMHACEFNSEFYADALFRELGIDRPTFIDTCTPTRKSEYLAGRYCARIALDGIGFTNINVQKNFDQTPRWPENISGSISHCRDYAVAAVATKSNYALVGIDCESIISAEVCDEIKSMIVDKNELQLISRAIGDLCTGVTLAISLKESFFKAIFPVYGVSMGFLDIEILSISADKRIFQIGCNANFSSIFKFNSFHGQYMFLDANTLLTLIAA